ncbi:MAG: hypothetical protein KDI14_02810 [Halioglobus sp.]|nr:hypothetical protein [Halioglobus sp.]
MNRIIGLALLLCALPAGATGGPVELAALGSLQLEFEQAVPVEVYPGQRVAAQVTFRKGEAFNVPSPGRVQQIEYLVEPGAAVQQGQPFAVLRGPEMHHFEMRFESSQALAESAERRFKSNRELYKRKAISESQWQEISEKYYELMLEYEHMRHFFELVVGGDNDPDALTLAAPLASQIDYSSAEHRVEEGDSIAQFVPASAIRLEVALPVASAREVSAVRVGDCELAIERVGAMTDGFFVQAWTGALPASCGLMLGQQVLATPLLRVSGAYRVPRTAVFQLEHESFVLVRSGASLTAVAVVLLAAEDGDYVLQTATPLDAADVLVSSVSAVQGIMLGLGGE